MVGLAGIPFPLVAKLVDRVSEYIVDAVVFRGLKYMFCYKSLVNDLNSETEKLNIEEDRISRKVGEARDDGKIIYDHVLKWQTDVLKWKNAEEEIQESAEEVSPSCWCIQRLPIPDLVTRFYIARNAAKKTKTIAEFYESGKESLDSEIAYLPPTENVPTTYSEFQKFQSREDAYHKFWEALVNDDSARILGIHGMPGVGKTRMMEQLWDEAKNNNIFNRVVRVDVGREKINVINLQQQIAGDLKCHFDSQDNVESRAAQLKRSIMNRGKSLIILDDVWEEIYLHRIGIPFGDASTSNSCKILLTSRKEDVCLQNNCNYRVKITPLTSDEAWDLFSNTVGDKIDSLQDETLAKKVCYKCAGLPLVILVVGKALKFRQHCSWKDALDQLENCRIERVPGIDNEEVYASLKLSFDDLEEDARRYLLLCSLLPDDANIHIKKLVQLATGSQLVNGKETRVGAMVDKLKLSSLLLEGKNDQVFKLHDIIRDLARSISAADPKYGFVFARCSSSLPNNYAEYGTAKLLHLELEENNFQFPHDLMFPDLHTLSLRSIGEGINQVRCVTTRSYIEKISGSMFGNLRFLVLVNFSWERQFSLQRLEKLKTLVIEHCDISYIRGDTDVSFFPESLDTLCIWKCHLPVPLDLPNLKYLRKLEIQQLKDNVIIVVPNAISSLSKLEELHIPAGFFTTQDDELLKSITLYKEMDIPGSTLVGQPVAGLIFDEISKLIRLTSLQISFDDTEVFQSTHIFRHLNEYNICVGFSDTSCSHPILHVPTTRLIELHGCQLTGMETLLERAEEVVLEKIVDFKGIIICSSTREAFADLKTLYVDECNNMECLARISQNEIQHTLQTRTFSTLTILKITSCSAIKYLFCESVAKCLVQLQVLRIYSCPKMEVIVMNKGISDGDTINLPKLKTMELSSLPMLTSFHRRMHSGSTSINDNSVIPSVQRRPSYNGMVAFPSLEHLIIQWLDHNDTIDIMLQIKKASRAQV